MSQPVIQHSFHTGEWAPSLNARVDLKKYFSGAALLENFFVDYRGGASSRMGTKYVLQAFSSGTVRLVGFQPSFNVGYILEFGANYIRPFYNGSPILESPITVTAITKANPGVVSATNSYSNGDWVYLSGLGGMSQANNRYYQVGSVTGGSFALLDLNGNNVNTTSYSTFTSGGTAQRVLTISSPYAAADLFMLKFAANVNELIITHASYTPRKLTFTSATSWALSSITFGPGISAPESVSMATTLSAGTVNYAYLVTAINNVGDESQPSNIGTLSNRLDLRTNAGTNRVQWGSASSGVIGYNIYKAELVYASAVGSGAAFGYIGSATGVVFDDSNIEPDFTQTPRIVQNPFAGAGVNSITVTAAGSYTTVPTVTIGAAPVGGTTATAQAVMRASSIALVNGGGGAGGRTGVGYAVGDTVTLPNGIIITVATVTAASSPFTGFAIATFTTTYLGDSVLSIPTNPVSQVSTSGQGGSATFNVTYGVTSVSIVSPGTAYVSPPSVTFAPTGATATASITSGSSGTALFQNNPSVPAFFQQRLVLAAPQGAVQSFYMSISGSYYNFDYSNPVQADDAITASINSGRLSEIKSMIPMPSGLVMLTTSGAWLVNGGTQGQPVTPSNIVAHPQSYNGANDIPPIVSNFDILYVQAKGSVVRDLSYNLYANVWTGTDITAISSHLFYGYTLIDWAWAEEPFKIVWATRNDGTLLSLTFMKEQELVGWTHNTTNGSFKSVATVIEQISTDYVDAVYVVVQRTVGGTVVNYIERMADRNFTSVTNAWCVDAGIQYTGSPATSFSGAQHLAGMTVTGLADGTVIEPFTMGADGSFTLATAASIVTVGLGYECNLKTLQLDIGNADGTIQGKMKKIPEVTVRVAQTLGLWIGSDEDNLVAMKDLVIGNIGSATNEQVTDLVTGDAMTVIDPKWSVPGQYYIQQPDPLPATILGVIPQVEIGDTKK